MVVVQTVLTLGWIIAGHTEQSRDNQDPGNDEGTDIHSDEGTPMPVRRCLKTSFLGKKSPQFLAAAQICGVNILR